MDGLKALETTIRRDMARVQYPARAWVPPRTTRKSRSKVLDVLIIGAGQGGLAAAAALQREKVDNILVVDQNPLDRAGPWMNFARMVTLRTPKHVTGPDLGLPSLTIQSWYEAQHGEGSWEALGLIPKETWASYLAWYRAFLEIPVRAATRAVAVGWDEGEGELWAELSCDGQRERVFARRVVLATGIEGSGQWNVPGFIRDALPDERYSHTRGDIDFEALAGRRVAVLGAGASAFDNASVALEAGAAKVDLFFRRDKLVDVNPYRWAEFVGFLHHHGDLPDAQRWRFIRQLVRMGQLPPPDTFARARKHPAFSLQPASPWTAVELVDDTIRITTPKGTFEADFVIAGTGFVTDLATRPELATVHEHVARWSDRYTPPADEQHADLARHPYLGRSFEFMPRVPEASPWVSRIHNYTFGCLPSLGFGGASISGMKYSIPRLVGGITASLYREDAEGFYASLCAYDTKEFDV
ncbi:MAG: NAD(P)/FAD-dependent oxidoreductase [Myxococcota bacterium]